MHKKLSINRSNDAVVFSPGYNPLPNKPKTNFQLQEYMIERSIAKKKNLAAFFESMHDNLRVAPESWGKRTDIDSSYFGDNDNLQMRHKADAFSRYGRCVVKSEVKASSSQSGKWLLPLVQTKIYAVDLINRLEKEKLPVQHYALFFYGRRNNGYDVYKCERSGVKDKRTTMGRHLCDNNCLNSNVASDVKHIVILPFNLILGLISSSEFHRRYVHNQESSQFNKSAQGYLHLKTSVASRLNGYKVDGVKDVDELLGDHVEDSLVDFLELRKLRLFNGHTPSNLESSVNGASVPVSSVPIAMFDFPKAAERRWLDNLSEHGEWLFEEKLGLGPLYDNSFDVEEFDIATDEPF